MTAPTTPRPGRHLHEAGFYRSDEEFTALVVDFVDSAVAAGEPVVIGYDERKNGIVRSRAADATAVHFIEDTDLYATPTRAIAAYQRQFEKLLGEGATRIRIAGEVPHPGNGGSFAGWDRYEAGINTLWRDLPVWSRCLYDATTVPPAVQEAVRRAHPQLVVPHGPAASSPDFQDLQHFRFLPVTPDPVEADRPARELVDPELAATRHAVRDVGAGVVDHDVLDDLVFATSEAVANGSQHGRPPVTVRIWRGPRRLVVTVHDTGPGPRDRTAGLVARTGSPTGAGMGLWITGQLEVACDLVWAPDGFTVRLRGGTV